MKKPNLMEGALGLSIPSVRTRTNGGTLWFTAENCDMLEQQLLAVFVLYWWDLLMQVLRLVTDLNFILWTLRERKEIKIK